MSVRRTGYKVIVPSSCEEVFVDSGNVDVDLQHVDNLQTFNCAYWTGMNWKIDNFLNCLSDKKNLKTLVLNYAGFCEGEISGLSNFSVCDDLSLHMTHTGVTNLIFDKDINGITNINLNDSKSFYTLTGFEHLKKLNSLTFNNCYVSSLVPLRDITSLTWIEANNNKISSLDGVQNLVNLGSLNVGNNSISNLYWLEQLVKNEVIKLKILDLSDNSLENNVTASIDTDGDGQAENVFVDNIKIIKELYNKGVTSIDVSNNNFSDTSELSSLSGVKY